jgi:serine/threonine protein kinase
MSFDVLNALPRGYQLLTFRIERVLGAGAFGITYLAIDLETQKQVAIKEYLPCKIADRATGHAIQPRTQGDREAFQFGLKRFVQEAGTLALFRHTNIVKIQRFFETNGTAYIVMDFERGASLAKMMIDDPSPFSESEMLELALPLLDGLAEVHKRGFLHRDIKPGNIFITLEGRPLLIDFGSARDVMAREQCSVTNVLTPGFAPFEQYFRNGDQGPWTDIYAFGAVLYCMVSGEAPPEAPERMHKDRYIPAVVRGKGRFATHLLEAIDWALAPETEKRPQSVEQWRTKLVNAASAAAKPAAAAAENNLLKRVNSKQLAAAVQPAAPAEVPVAPNGRRGLISAARVVAEAGIRRRRRYALAASLLVLAATGSAAAMWITGGEQPGSARVEVAAVTNPKVGEKNEGDSGRTPPRGDETPKGEVVPKTEEKPKVEEKPKFEDKPKVDEKPKTGDADTTKKPDTNDEAKKRTEQLQKMIAEGASQLDRARAALKRGRAAEAKRLVKEALAQAQGALKLDANAAKAKALQAEIAEFKRELAQPKRNDRRRG